MPPARNFNASCAFAILCLAASPVAQAGLPELRLSASNTVPGCVTPQRLMSYMERSNEKLHPRFKEIAARYQEHGETLGIRWDYAFFQMLLETNYLKYTGADNPKQNNFAGIGTTGGGVRGNSFPDVSSGVLAQMQHLVAYSGERVGNPVASRTAENQDDIIAISRKLGRPLRFSDLQMRWAIDRGYAKKIEAVANRFFAAHCPDPNDRGAVLEAAASQPRSVPAPTPVYTGRLVNAAGSGP